MIFIARATAAFLLFFASPAYSNAVDPYQVLGVSPGASDSEIKSRYHELVKKHGLGANVSGSADAERLKEINVARDQIRQMRLPKIKGTFPTGEELANGLSNVFRNYFEQGGKSATDKERNAKTFKANPNLGLKVGDYVGLNNDVRVGKIDWIHPNGGSLTIEGEPNVFETHNNPYAMQDKHILREVPAREFKPGMQVMDFEGNVATVRRSFENGYVMVEGKPGFSYGQMEWLFRGNPHTLVEEKTIKPAPYPYLGLPGPTRTVRSASTSANLLSVVSVPILAAKTVTDHHIFEALQAGKCPDEKTAPASSIYEMSQYVDLASLQQSIQACAANTKPLGFTSQLNTSGFPRVTCDRKGQIKIVHKNGTSSEIKFAADDTVVEIKTFSPDDSQGFSVSYQATDLKNKTPWKVSTEMLVAGKKTSRAETFASFSNRLRCMREACPKSELFTYFDSIDDATTPDTPFGLLSGSQANAVASSMVSARNALVATFLTNRSFRKTCVALGTEAPALADIIFSDPPNASSPPPIDSAPAVR